MIQNGIGKAMRENDNVLRAGYLSDNTGQPKMRAEAAPGPAGRRNSAGGLSRELAVLRKHRFQIKPAEQELRLSQKSRTLSNHLRGICIRALSENEWNPQRAAQALAQSDAPAIAAKLEGKIRRYIENIRRNARHGTERKLYNNLPAAYHDALNKAITPSAERTATASHRSGHDLGEGDIPRGVHDHLLDLRQPAENIAGHQ
jgi:hypothetical protein